jgi:hypothetical protein
MPSRNHKPPFKVRSSRIQGLGAFATQRIRKGTRIIEYVGERISSEEADARYDDDITPNPHVLLFVVDKRTVVDAGVGGNEARFINHSCDPNCEPVIESRRIYIEAIRTIEPGEELTYDYNLTREDGDDAETEGAFTCRCGAPTCRGTMLEQLPKRKPKRKKAK